MASPGARHACPNSAACWSPAIPAIGTSRPPICACPQTPDDGTTAGNIARGMSSSARSSSSHSPVWMSNSSVRLALLASVQWTRPPVKCQISHESTVPNASSPRCALARAPSTWSSSQRTFVPEKYASSTRPVFCANSGAWPAARNSSHSGAVRRSCQTIALAIGRPVARSQTTVVSRWFVMPIAATSSAPMCALASASCRTPDCVAQISVASCSTQPGCGKICRNSACATARTVAVAVEQDRARTGRALIEGQARATCFSSGCRACAAQRKILRSRHSSHSTGAASWPDAAPLGFPH